MVSRERIAMGSLRERPYASAGREQRGQRANRRCLGLGDRIESMIDVESAFRFGWGSETRARSERTQKVEDSLAHKAKLELGAGLRASELRPLSRSERSLELAKRTRSLKAALRARPAAAKFASSIIRFLPSFAKLARNLS